MKGLNRTAPLKFDHSGIATTAERSGNALLLQNDTGQTDAHLLAIQVVGLSATLTTPTFTLNGCRSSEPADEPQRRA
jgi:hypothetical protein